MQTIESKPGAGGGANVGGVENAIEEARERRAEREKSEDESLAEVEARMRSLGQATAGRMRIRAEASVRTAADGAAAERDGSRPQAVRGEEGAESPRHPERREDEESRRRQERRRAEMMEQLEAEYRVTRDGQYFFRDRGTLAFREAGKRVVTALNDERVVFSMVAVAAAKGWEHLKVTGHEDFRRMVWLEANLRGIGVRGYVATEQDHVELEARRERLVHNAVERLETLKSAEKAKEPERRGPVAQAAPSASKGREEDQPVAVHEPQQQEKPLRQVSERQVPGMLEARDAATSAPEAPSTGRGRQEEAPEAAHENKPLRQFEGVLLAHGAAPYKQQEENDPSYYVTIQASKGPGRRGGKVTVWGVDLAEAMGAAGAQVGDYLRLRELGKRPVEVMKPVYDGEGKVVRREPATALRNKWHIESEPMQQQELNQRVITAVAKAVAQEKTRSPATVARVMDGVLATIEERKRTRSVPSVYVFDEAAAPSRAPVAEVAVQRHGERTR